MFEALRPADETIGESESAVPGVSVPRVAWLVLVALLLHILWAAEFVALETEMEPFRFVVTTTALTLFPFVLQGLSDYRTTHRRITIGVWLLLGVLSIPLVLIVCGLFLLAVAVAGFVPVRM